LLNGGFVPKLYEYFGIVLFFYSNEHEPIHVHARWQDCESKVEFEILDGKVVEVTLKKVAGKKQLPASKRAEFVKISEVLAEEIIQSWLNYFVWKKKIVFKKIEKIEKIEKLGK
jgi:Domain of unknown function (DUF4160)